MLTFLDKQLALLADLERERAEYGPRWEMYYDGKIAEMREAIYGSGAGVKQAGSTGVQDVPGGPSQTL